MTQKNLKQKAVSGIIWTALQRYSTIIIQFISGIILARLLTPYDYGCIGMLMIFVVIAESFIDGGFGSALIQKKQPTQEDYSTIFFWNIGMSVVLYIILYFSSPAIARFYNIPLLCDVLRVQGIILFIYAFNIVQRILLQKNLNFKILSIVTMATSITSLSITIIMAYRGFGVWSLVTQFLLMALIPTITFFFYVKWRPQMCFSIQSFKELFSFGFYMFLIQLLNQFSRQIQGLLIGKFFNAATMGYYSKAYATERVASTSISQVLTQVTYPLYAEVQDDKKALSNMIKRLTMSLSYFTFPLMFLLILCAKPIFVILYTERWLESVFYFQILCFVGLAFCLQSVNDQSIAAIGKSKELFIWTILKRAIGIFFMVVGMIVFGMKGLLFGVVLNTWIAYFINIGLVSKYIGYSWTIQLLNLMPALIASVISAFIAYSIGRMLNFSLFLDGMVKVTVFAVVYLGWSFICKPKSYEYLKDVLKPMIARMIQLV